MEQDRLAALEHERELERRRLDNEIQLREILKQQVAELQQREKEVCSTSERCRAESQSTKIKFESQA